MCHDCSGVLPAVVESTGLRVHNYTPLIHPYVKPVANMKKEKEKIT